MTRILLVDDSEALRRSVRPLIEAAFAGVVVGEAADGASGLAALAEAWDLVLLDLSLRDRAGLDVLRELRRRAPALPVVVMSLHAEADYGPAARAAGAAAYVDKADVARAIVPVIARTLGVPDVTTPPSSPSPERQEGDPARRRLARALHDDVGQALVAAKLELQLAEGEPEADVRRRVGTARSLVDAAIVRVRALAAELRLDRMDDLEGRW